MAVKNQEKHKQIIQAFLKDLPADDFVLKGGTALMFYYGLDRFSEDIDLDSERSDLQEYLEQFCHTHGFTYTVKKDGDLAKAYSMFMDNGWNGYFVISVAYQIDANGTVNYNYRYTVDFYK